MARESGVVVAAEAGRLDRARWAAAALAAGTVAGLVAAQGLVDWTRMLAAVVGTLVVALVLWRYEIGAVLMLFSLPLDIYGRLIEKPVVVTVFHVMLGLTLVSFALRRWASPDRRVRFSAVDVGIAALVAAAVWSLPFSLDRRDTVIAIVRLLFLWAFVLVYANAMSSRRVAAWVAWTLVATGVLNGAVALAQYFIPGFTFGNVRSVNQGAGTGVVLNRVGALFWDPNYLAGFLCVAFLTAAALFAHARRWQVAVVSLVSAGVIGGGLLVTFSRTGWVGAAVGLVVVTLTAPKRRRLPMLLTGVALALAVTAVSPGLVLDRIQSIGEVQEDVSNATRYHMFFSSLEMIRDRPAFGTGLSAFDVAFPAYRRLGTAFSVIRPHQLPLALWAEMGVAGLVAELTLLGAIIATFWRRRPKGWHVLEAIAAAGLVSLLVQSWFQYYLYFEYLWLFVALSVAGNRLGRLDEEAANGTT